MFCMHSDSKRSAGSICGLNVNFGDVSQYITYFFEYSKCIENGTVWCCTVCTCK